MQGQKKASIIYVLKILEEYSDENHLLTHQQIIDLIYQKYDLLLERKSIANSISLLEDLGYDILKGERGGVCLMSRLFDPSETHFLVDAIYSSKVITASQAKNLSKTIFSTLSKYERKQYQYIHKSQEINRNINSEFFYSIDLINEAISKNKMISFQYITHNSKGEEVLRYNGYKYKVSPYFLINNFGKYYLLCHYYKYDGRGIFRIDLMRNIEILETAREDIDKVEAYGPNFNISKYINDHIYIFGGKTINSTFRLKNEWTVSSVIDWFGNNATIYNKDGNLYADIKCDDQAVYHWAIQYCNDVEVISPYNLRNRVITTLETVVKSYQENPIEYTIDELDLKNMIFDFNSSIFKLNKDVVHDKYTYIQELSNHIYNTTKDFFKFDVTNSLTISNNNTKYLIEVKLFESKDYNNEINSLVDDIKLIKNKNEYEKKYLIGLSLDDYYFNECGRELFNELVENNNIFNDVIFHSSNKTKKKIEWFNIPKLQNKTRAKYFLIEIK